MSLFFQPYEGKLPYLFVSYSHKNSREVLETITGLNKKLRIWYDEGIPAGSDWPMNIQIHMEKCGAVLFFLSKTALASPNCLSEIRTAVSLRRPVLYLPLDDSEPDSEWAKLLNACTRLDAPQDALSREQAVLKSPLIKKRFYRKWTDHIPWKAFGFFAALLIFLAAAVLMALLLKGVFDPPAPPATPSPTLTWTPKPTASPHPTPTVDPNNFPVTFPDVQQENAVRDQLNKYDGSILRTDLSSVTELYFCGGMYLSDPGSVSYEGGRFKVGSSFVVEGKVKDLSVIGSMGFLQKLALIDQPVTDLQPLTKLVLLEELYLSGCEISSLEAVSHLPSLKVLHLEHCSVSDLRPLISLPSLQSVYVSADMLPLTVQSERGYEIYLVP